MELNFSLQGIDEAATVFWEKLHSFRVFAFTGEMGAGKTTFIAALCKKMGVKDIVSSPTFSLINEYRSEDAILYHLDLYRIRSLEEAVSAGIEEVLHSGQICLVEWPEKAPSLFPEKAVWIHQEITGSRTRKLIISTDESM